MFFYAVKYRLSLYDYQKLIWSDVLIIFQISSYASPSIIGWSKLTLKWEIVSDAKLYPFRSVKQT